jgi:hypothetical protein
LATSSEESSESLGEVFMNKQEKIAELQKTIDCFKAIKEEFNKTDAILAKIQLYHIFPTTTRLKFINDIEDMIIICNEIVNALNNKEDFSKMTGCGVYAENGIQIENDYCIITENGVSKKVSRKEGAEYVEKVLRG